jgi:hypothetical protein
MQRGSPERRHLACTAFFSRWHLLWAKKIPNRREVISTETARNSGLFRSSPLSFGAQCSFWLVHARRVPDFYGRSRLCLFLYLFHVTELL